MPLTTLINNSASSVINATGSDWLHVPTLCIFLCTDWLSLPARAVIGRCFINATEAVGSVLQNLTEAQVLEQFTNLVKFNQVLLFVYFLLLMLNYGTAEYLLI